MHLTRKYKIHDELIVSVLIQSFTWLLDLHDNFWLCFVVLLGVDFLRVQRFLRLWPVDVAVLIATWWSLGQRIHLPQPQPHHCHHNHTTVATIISLSPQPHHCYHNHITVTTITSLSPQPHYCYHNHITVTTITSLLPQSH